MVASSARARQEALALNRDGRFDEARQVIERVARKIESSAGSDPELCRLVAELRDQIEAFALRMEALQMKRLHFASYVALQSRLPDGKARKRQAGGLHGPWSLPSD